MAHPDLLALIGVAIIAATIFALLARALRQPLILAYLLAGVAIGPQMGLGMVKDQETIALISEFGLILLLFIIGLEMDLQKLMGAGRALVSSGLGQFPICVAMGVGFALLLGFPLGGGRFDALYLAVAMSLSSTMIVVKLLYDKYELMTLPGRITLGILVFQDVWAIVVLAVQPTLMDPSVTMLFASFAKGGALIAASLLVSRYALPHVFRFIAKLPELMLVAALAWCFLVSGAASHLSLSREMGALVAGIAMSTFPYNLDVIAKVTNIRDFFVTLFFVALGMQIPLPTASILGLAAACALFLVASRFLSVFPILYLLKQGTRTSLLPSINTSQMSEFSLVIVAIGFTLGHVQASSVAVLTFVFAITSVASTYMITYNHQLQAALGRGLRVLGFHEMGFHAAEDAPERDGGGIVFAGFFRDASSILHQFEMESTGTSPHLILKEILVIDFNPAVLTELKKRRIACLYGDIASMETLHHASIHAARVLVCTITDDVLKGTTNERLLQQGRRLSPGARVIVAANTIRGALELYDRGADFVFVPRIHSDHFMAEVIESAFEDDLRHIQVREIERLRHRKEVLA
jgi:Kef-type K+ transport system membrane component KefB